MVFGVVEDYPATFLGFAQTEDEAKTLAQAKVTVHLRRTFYLPVPVHYVRVEG